MSTTNRSLPVSLRPFPQRFSHTPMPPLPFEVNSMPAATSASCTLISVDFQRVSDTRLKPLHCAEVHAGLGRETILGPAQELSGSTELAGVQRVVFYDVRLGSTRIVGRSWA